MGPECACGCGEHLPEGSTREYKRGHKPKKDGFTQTQISHAQNAFNDSMLNDDGFTLEDAANSIESDPEPDEPGETPKVEAPIRITKSVKADVEGKLAFMFSMTANMVQIRDPFCGGVLLEQSPDIAAKLTPIICQSPDLVKWFRKGAGYMLYVDLFMAFMPVIQAIGSHHLSGSRHDVPRDAQAPIYAA